jgi:hypothetical protein
MKKIFVILGLLFLPVFAFADCSNSGTTVIFINGIFGDYIKASNDLYDLQKEFLEKYPNENINFITGFNESNLGGAGDLAKAIIQAYGFEDLDYDLTKRFCWWAIRKALFTLMQPINIWFPTEFCQNQSAFTILLLRQAMWPDRETISLRALIR